MLLSELQGLLHAWYTSPMQALTHTYILKNEYMKVYLIVSNSKMFLQGTGSSPASVKRLQRALKYLVETSEVQDSYGKQQAFLAEA